VSLSSTLERRHSPKKPNPVVLRSLPQTAWTENRKVQPEPVPATPIPTPTPKHQASVEKEQLPIGRVVDVPDGNSQKPSEAKFLAETNNRVEKETVARHRTLEARVAKRKQVGPAEWRHESGEQSPEKIAAKEGNGGTADDDSSPQQGSKKKVPERPDADPSERLALRFDGLDGRYRLWNLDRLPLGRSSQTATDTPGAEDVPGSLGREGEASQSLPASAPAQDGTPGVSPADIGALDGIPEGDGTFLNTREWKYASFFNRLKRDVGSQWHPQGCRTTECRTLLAVVLDVNGQLKDLRIAQSSGVDSVDREAKEAFERAQPFRNPPPGLQNARGEIAFSFGFLIETNHAGLQWFRSR
jgi:TonB family protein